MLACFRLPRELPIRIPLRPSSFIKHLSTTTTQPLQEPLGPGTLLRSDSKRLYDVSDVLLERKFGSTFLRVYFQGGESAEDKNNVIKNVIPGEFEYNRNLQKKVSSSPNVRTVVDTVQAHIKTDNILINYAEDPDGLNIQDVQIADLDDSVDLPRGMWLQGALCGNSIWRSLKVGVDPNRTSPQIYSLLELWYACRDQLHADN
ncbi:hypothetical protein UA08_00260 [Talaromyces atroroseus]|uniref:Uncharacterized protein n=1 Tax=Talaromyces atroroseus TaxID=1441469 RepID=A0A225AYV3_TALAT|nr:hypothetical protein UA08_00260 [Talaromyces atroroseus]OKL63634.1 hypothetical protein UA08_00260 [Talaromyces atroroseus]